jgi:hypothetical protein
MKFAEILNSLRGRANHSMLFDLANRDFVPSPKFKSIPLYACSTISRIIITLVVAIAGGSRLAYLAQQIKPHH